MGQVKNKHILSVEYIIVLAFILFHFGNNYYKYFYPTLDANEIGYLDHVLNIEAFDRVLKGGVFHKDYFWWYGPLYLYIQIPFYYLGGKNHYALLFVQTQVLPTLGILLSYLYIRLLCKNSLIRILFIFICILHYVNNIWASPRHLGAELAIAFFIYSICNAKSKQYAFFAGCLTSIGILLGFEYGFPSLLAIGFGLICLAINRKHIPIKEYLFWYAIGLISLIGPLFLYLYAHSVLASYLQYYYDLVTNFSSNNPARSQWFPVFPSIKIDTPYSFFASLITFLLSTELRFYIPIIIYGLGIIYFSVKFFVSKDLHEIKFGILGIYGSMIYFRTLSSPSYQYLAYGLVPAITIGMFVCEKLVNKYLEKFKENKLKPMVGYSVLFASMFTWVVLSAENKSIFNFSAKNTNNSDGEKIYFEKVGFEVTKSTRDEYLRINQFVEENTTKDQYLFVYPWGYYNHWTERPSPLTARDGLFDLKPGEKYKQLAIKELEEKKPEFIILNTRRNLNAVKIASFRSDIKTQTSWWEEGSPNFKGFGNSIELYILENYKLLKEFKFAAILERNSKKKQFKRHLQEYEILGEGIKDKNQNKYDKENNILKVKSRNIRIEYDLKKEILASHIKIVYRINSDVFKKYFTKGSMSLGFTDTKESKYIHTFIDDSSDIGDRKIRIEALASIDEQPIRKIRSIWLEYKTREPYIKPKSLEIISLKAVLDETFMEKYLDYESGR